MNTYSELIDRLGDKYDFLKDYNYLQDLPYGWVKCFGKQFCEDLEVAIDIDGIKDYQVLQAKEKFGELRWYDNGGEMVQKVIDDYAHLSKHVCIVCGQMYVPIIDDGWVSPSCQDCYREVRGLSSTEDVDWDRITIRETDEEIRSPRYKISRFSQHGSTIVNRDIQYIIDRIDDKYKKGS